MTDQTLQNFITKVGNYGIARNNKFEIILSSKLDSVLKFPESMLTKDYDIASIYAESVEIPGKSINTVPTRLSGKSKEMPMEFIYEGPLVMTFLVDTRQQVRQYFDKWLGLVFPNGENSSFNPSLPETYKHSLKIIVSDNILEDSENTQDGIKNPLNSFLAGLATQGKTAPVKANTKNKTVGEYTFYGIYPKSITGSQLSNAGKDFQRLRVIFAFDYYIATYPETTPLQSEAPKGNTGTGIWGSINGIANSTGKTIGGSINKVLGL